MTNTSSNTNQIFCGKYSFSNHDQSMLISLSGDKISLSTGNHLSPSENQMFNLYGDISSKFVMQAPSSDWNYIIYNQEFIASKTKTDPDLCQFYLKPIDSVSTYMVEIVSGVEYYLIANGSNLERIPKTNTPPPSTSIFYQNIITDSYQKMVTQHSTLANPLTGVDLSTLDISSIALMATDLSFANFYSCNLHKQNLNGATANGTSFDSANMSECIANGLNFVNCSFVNTNMQYIKMSNATLQSCILNMAVFSSPSNPSNDFTNLQKTNFTNASLVGCDFKDSLLNSCIFNGCNLTNTDFTNAKGVEESIDFRGATLIGAKLSNHDLSKSQLDSNTNFMNSNLDSCIFTSQDLSDTIFVRASMRNVNLDHCILNGTQMAFADLSYASLLGGISMIGCNLSNSNLQAAKMTGAQLGAKTTVTTIPASDAASLDNKKVPADLTQKPLEISPTATVTVLQPGSSWSIEDGNSKYSLSINGSLIIVQIVSPSTNAAILSNAYMANTNLDQANMYAVELSGAHWYGPNASAINADLGLANLSNSNLNGMTFTQSKMQGASFDYAKLIGTHFKKTNLSPADTLKPTSFAFASMQSTIFEETNLFFANLTNAAYAMDNGVPLFNIESSFVNNLNQGIISPDLQTVFNDNGYPLRDSAKITVNTQNQNWTINNIDTNDPSQTGYAHFELNLIQNPNDLKTILVSGQTPILALILDDKGSYTQMPMAFGPTNLSQDQLNSNTTCPSGMKFSMLGNHLTFKQLMTAAVPPKPPACPNCW